MDGMAWSGDGPLIWTYSRKKIFYCYVGCSPAKVKPSLGRAYVGVWAVFILMTPPLWLSYEEMRLMRVIKTVVSPGPHVDALTWNDCMKKCSLGSNFSWFIDLGGIIIQYVAIKYALTKIENNRSYYRFPNR